jgi:hypothetical protein
VPPSESFEIKITLIEVDDGVDNKMLGYIISLIKPSSGEYSLVSKPIGPL